MPEERTGSRPSLADKLNHLFATMRPSGRREYTLEEVAEEITRRKGVSISHTYIWQLRTGRRTNPSMNVVEALADFFGVSPAYFFDDEVAARIEAELRLLAALRDTSVRQIAFRAAGLSPQSLTRIAELVEHVRQLEGLPATPEEPNRPEQVDHPGEDASPSPERAGDTS